MSFVSTSQKSAGKRSKSLYRILNFSYSAQPFSQRSRLADLRSLLKLMDMCAGFKGLILGSPLSWVAFVIQTCSSQSVSPKGSTGSRLAGLQAFQTLALRHRAQVAREFTLLSLSLLHCTLWVMVTALSSWPRETESPVCVPGAHSCTEPLGTLSAGITFVTIKLESASMRQTQKATAPKMGYTALLPTVPMTSAPLFTTSGRLMLGCGEGDKGPSFCSC